MLPPKGFDLNDSPMAENLHVPAAIPSQSSTDSYGTLAVRPRDNPACSSFSFRQLASTQELGIDEDFSILNAVWNAYEHHDLDKIDDILAGVCEDLAQTSDRYHYLTLVYVSKKLPELFSLKRTFQAVLGFFNCINHTAVVKKDVILPLLACKLFLRAFEPMSHWPLEFVRIYLDDAVGPRVWIDHDGCKEFVANIVTAFSDHNGVPDSVENRYGSVETRVIVREEFLKSVHFLLGSSTKENLKQLLKLLNQGVGYEEIRVVASSMLESWLNSPIHLRAAKSLLDNILDNLHGVTDNDLVTVKNLLALQLQSAQSTSQVKTLLGNIYTEMLARLVSQRYEYGILALKTFVIAEMTAKSMFNIRCISIVMKSMPVSQPPEHELAKVLQDQALNVDMQSQLHELGHRLFKYLGQNLSVHELWNGLLQPYPEIMNQTEVVRKHWLSQMIVLACQFLLYGVSHLTFNENFAQTIKGLMSCKSRVSDDHAEFSPSLEALSMLERTSCDTLTFQVEALEWCTNTLPLVLPEISSLHFTIVVQKFLFLQELEAYFPFSERCGDLELNSYKLICACTQASEEILTRLIYMGVSNDVPLTRREAFQIVERLVLRAAASARFLCCTLKAESIQLPMAVFKLASVELPQTIYLQSMELVYRDLHWRSCIVVLMIAIYNLKNIGKYVWENIPTVRHLMEFLLKNEGDSTRTSCNGDSELQEVEVCRKEKEMEELIARHLSSIKTVNSSELSDDILEWKEKMMLMDYSITFRKALPSVLIELNEMEQLYLLSHSLLKFTEPDFFVELTTSQTLSDAWPWLQRVLIKEPSSVQRLPLSWQVELLYVYEGFYPGKSLDLSHLYTSLHMAISQDNKDALANVETIFNYFVHKLASAEFSLRSRARRCLSGIMESSCLMRSNSFGQSFVWLSALVSFPLPKHVLENVIAVVCSAIQLESSIDVVIAYLVFLEEHLRSIQSLHSLAVVVANLIIKRRMLFRYLLEHSQRAHTSESFSRSISIASMFAKILKDALGMSCPLSVESVKSQTVILVLPISNLRKEIVKKEVPKCVVDATLELLAQLSAMECHNDDYECMIQLLFPGFVDPQSQEGKFSMAWLEDSFGRQTLLLSESQSHAFCRCNDVRLIKVGLSMLGTNAKVEAFTSLGVSSNAIESFLDNHRPILNLSSAELKEDYISKMKNGWKERELMKLIVSVSENGSSETVVDTQLQDSAFDEDTDLILSTCGRISNVSFQDILLCAVPPGASIQPISSYLQVRWCLQEVNFCSEASTWLQKAETLLREPSNPDIRRQHMNDTLSLRLQLPLYLSLSGCKAALIYLKHEKIHCPSVEIIKQLICTFFQDVHILVGQEDTASQDNFSCIVSQIVEALQEKMLQAHAIEHGVEDCRFQNKLHPLNSESITFGNFESIMMRCMQLRYHIEQEHGMQSNTLLKLLDEVSILTNDYLEQGIPGFDKRIARVGINALYINLVKFLYADLIGCDHLMRVLTDLFQPTTTLQTKWIVVPLVLHWVFRQSSWEFAINTLQRLLTTLSLSLQKGLFEDGTNIHHMVSCYTLMDHFLSFGAMLDFFHVILHRPSTQLTSFRDVSEYSQEFVSVVSASMFTPLSAKLICNLVNMVWMLSFLLPSQYCTVDERHGSILRSFRSGTIRECCLKYRETASRVIIHMASQHDRMLRMIVNELVYATKKVEWHQFDRSNFGRRVEEECKASAKGLLWMLYTVWPVSVQSALPTMNHKDMITSDGLLGIDTSSQFQECTLQHGRSSKSIIHGTVAFSLCNSTNENDAAYRFCRTFAKQHPVLLLYYMPAFGGLLKEFLEMIRIEDIEVQKKVACSLKMGIILMDSLRPHLFHCTRKIEDKDDEANRLWSSCAPNSVLDVYMDFLQCIESQDITYYGTIIAKLAEFLCHCVTFGGRWRAFVKDHRNEVLEAASKKFSKIKKLSYVLTLLDNCDDNDRYDNNTAETAFTPSMPLEEVRTVREHLLQFSYSAKMNLMLDDDSMISRSRKRRRDDRFPESEIKEYRTGLLATLRDLEQASSCLPSVLSLLRDVLVDLIHTTDTEISDIVYNLLERSLYECPSDNDREVLETLLVQLATGNPVQMKAAASQAARFFFLFPDLQETLLIEMFHHGPEDLQKLLAEITGFL